MRLKRTVQVVSEQRLIAIRTAMRDARLSVGAKALYALLASTGDERGMVAMSQGELGKSLGCTIRTARTYARSLREMGYIEIEKKPSASGFCFRNIYMLCDPAFTMKAGE